MYKFPDDVGVSGLQGVKCRVVRPGEVKLRVGQAKRREVQNSAVLEHLHPVAKSTCSLRCG